MTDAESLLKNGENVPRTAAVPNFLRAAALRVVGGSQLLGAAFAGLCTFAAETTEGQISCAISAAVCVVAFYHYLKLITIRENAKPGNEIAVEMACDAIRYSDWIVRLHSIHQTTPQSPSYTSPCTQPSPNRSQSRSQSIWTMSLSLEITFSGVLCSQVTLPPMIVDLHVVIGVEPYLFPASVQPLLLVLMVMLGSFVRLGLDELAPGGVTILAKVLGSLAFVVATILLAFVLVNLLGSAFPIPSLTVGWVAALSLVWICYGLVAILAMIWRQFAKKGKYPEGLSITKDLLFGALDTWSKSTLAYFCAMKALGKEDLMFSL